MFDLSSLQYNSEFPALFAIIITVISSMILGTVIAFTYDMTSRDVRRPNHFLQAMILVTIVAATVIQAIGDSVARGLGMIGALSIIRFRTTVRDPRNLVFMFGSIAVGIATGVFGFLIAFVGTIGFCLTAFLLYFSPFSPKDDFIGQLKLEIDTSLSNKDELKSAFKKYSKKYQLTKQQVNIKKGFNFTTHFYEVKLKNENELAELLETLNHLDGVNVSRFELDGKTPSNI